MSSHRTETGLSTAPLLIPGAWASAHETVDAGIVRCPTSSKSSSRSLDTPASSPSFEKGARRKSRKMIFSLPGSKTPTRNRRHVEDERRSFFLNDEGLMQLGAGGDDRGTHYPAPAHGLWKWAPRTRNRRALHRPGPAGRHVQSAARPESSSPMRSRARVRILVKASRWATPSAREVCKLDTPARTSRSFRARRRARPTMTDPTGLPIMKRPRPIVTITADANEPRRDRLARARAARPSSAP